MDNTPTWCDLEKLKGFAVLDTLVENATNLRSCFYPPNSTIDGCSALAEAYIEIIGLLGEILGAQESPESIDALANEIQRLSLECESLLTSQAGYEGRSKLDSDRFWILIGRCHHNMWNAFCRSPGLIPNARGHMDAANDAYNKVHHNSAELFLENHRSFLTLNYNFAKFTKDALHDLQGSQLLSFRAVDAILASRHPLPLVWSTDEETRMFGELYQGYLNAPVGGHR